MNRTDEKRAVKRGCHGRGAVVGKADGAPLELCDVEIDRDGARVFLSFCPSKGGQRVTMVGSIGAGSALGALLSNVTGDESDPRHEVALRFEMTISKEKAA